MDQAKVEINPIDLTKFFHLHPPVNAPHGECITGGWVGEGRGGGFGSPDHPF